MLDPILAVGAFVSVWGLGGAVSAATSIASFTAANASFAGGFGGEGCD